MRAPLATARCAWPIHMPSMRSGNTSIPSSRVKVTKSPSVMRPETTARPPMRSTAATASVGRNSSSGRYDGALARRLDVRVEHVLRALAEALRLALLLAEGLHDAHADDVLLGLRRHVGEALLHVGQHGVRDARVARRDAAPGAA